MKILYIANIRLPTEKAHGVQIMKTCEAFATLGHEVTLAVPTRKTPITDDPFTYYGVKPNFSIMRLRTPDLMRFGPIGFLFSALWLSEQTRFLRVFREADIIYSRDAFVLLQYVLLGRELVLEAHADPTFIERLVARFAYRIVAISGAGARSFAEIGVPDEKIVIAPDGIDLEAFAHPESREAARARLGLPLDKKVALYAGRLDGWKGVDTLCEAAELLSDDTSVVVIGGEPEQVAAFSARYPHVRFLGFRPYRELPDNQAAADVLVLPNTAKNKVSMHYTSPLKLFTYMASGVPAAISDTPSSREILSEEDTYFFAPDDSRALADSIREILADEDDARKRATAAKRKVSGYTWEKRAANIITSLIIAS